MVYFQKNKHKYFNDAGESYLSVTTFLKRFKNFDEEYWLAYKALEAIRNNFKKDIDGKYEKMPGFYKSVVKFKNIEDAVKPHELDLFNQTKIDIKKAWVSKTVTATDFGTSYHKMNEDRDIKAKESLNSVDGISYPVIELPECKEDNCSRESYSTGCYLELLIHSDKHMLAGQSDKVFFVSDKDFMIRDMKTNSELKKESFKNTKMEYPFNTLDDCALYHYAIQLGIYAYMLELQGYNCLGLYVDHYQEEIKLEYYKDMIHESMIIRELELSLQD